MLQVDREIAKAESQIAKLKKKQQEQEAASRRSTSEDDSDKKEEQETKQPKSVSQTIYADNRVRRKLGQTLYFVEYVSQIAQLVEYHLYRNALNTKSQSPKGQFTSMGDKLSGLECTSLSAASRRKCKPCYVVLPSSG